MINVLYQICYYINFPAKTQAFSSPQQNHQPADKGRGRDHRLQNRPRREARELRADKRTGGKA